MIGRLLPWTAGTAAWNMAVDEAILTGHQEGTSPLTLRFYGWDPPALSFGCFQNPLTKAERTLVRGKQVDYVKRPTGGRAVFHDDEITYSLIAGEKEGFTGPVLADYLRIAKGLKRGFELLGLQVQLAEGTKQREAHSRACFASPSWYEITSAGKKLVGSAQLRRGGSLLQHGSILITFDPLIFLELMGGTRREDYTAVGKRLQQSIIGLQEILGYYPKKSEVISSLVEGLGSSLGVSWRKLPLTAKEISLAQKLETEKYSNPLWNEKRGMKGSWRRREEIK